MVQISNSVFADALKQKHEDDDSVLKSLFSQQRLHVVFSGGGIVGLYQLGVIVYIMYRHHRRAARRANSPASVRIQGTSVGCISAIFLALMLSESSEQSSREFTIEKFMDFVKDNFEREYTRENNNIANALRNVLRELLPENVHEICTDKVFITLNVFQNFRFRNKVVSRFFSKEHLIDVVHSSTSIHFLTIPWFWKTYHCPFEGRSYAVVDGILNAKLPPISELTDTTLHVNIIMHSYPFVKRLHLFEKSYDFMVVDGIKDAKAFFASNGCGLRKPKTLYIVTGKNFNYLKTVLLNGFLVFLEQVFLTFFLMFRNS